MLDKTFSIFGIPDELKTDNGPPFRGSEIAYFAKHMGFKHCKVTPLWPRAIGECERFMRNLGKVVQGARTENKPWKQELYKFLRNYRANHDMRQRDANQKDQMMEYEDQRRHATPSNINPGDIVLVKQPNTTKPLHI